MSGALIMVWVGTAASLAAHEADVNGWAESRERSLESPGADAPLAPARHDDALSEGVEALLAEARTEAYSSGVEAAKAALDAAERLVMGSRNLPESAWLVAEILRERAAIVADTDPQVAAEFERRAALLSGPQATRFFAGSRPDPKSRRDGGAPADAPASSAALPVGLEGPLATDAVDVDGVEVAVPRIIPDGTHHVRVLRGGRLAWDGWIATSGEDAHIPAPLPTPCSEADLSPSDTAKEALSPVRCEDYAKARPAGPERIEVALCHRSSCGAWLPWSRAWGATFEGPVHSPHTSRGSRAWVLWALAGAATVIVGGFVMAEEGVFDRRGSTRQSFTFVPPK